MRRCRSVILGATLGCALLTLGPLGRPVQAADDRVEVERIARDYIESWYTADPARMARALHPDLVKRRVEALPYGQQAIENVSRDDMIEMTRNGGGSGTPPGQRNISVEVLDISGEIAAVKTVTSQYVDILSMAKIRGQWVIVNVLWRLVPQPGSPETAKR